MGIPNPYVIEAKTPCLTHNRVRSCGRAQPRQSKADLLGCSPCLSAVRKSSGVKDDTTTLRESLEAVIEESDAGEPAA